MPISGQPGIGKGGPGAILGQLREAFVLSPSGQRLTPTEVARLQETFIGTLQLGSATRVTEITGLRLPIGIAKVAAPSAPIQPAAPFAKAPAVPGPVRASEKPSGPIHVTPPPLPRPGRTFRRPAGVLAQLPPSSEGSGPMAAGSAATDILIDIQDAMRNGGFQAIAADLEARGLVRGPGVVPGQNQPMITVQSTSPSGFHTRFLSGPTPAGEPQPVPTGNSQVQVSLKDVVEWNARTEVINKLSHVVSIGVLLQETIKARQRGNAFIPFAGEVNLRPGTPLSPPQQVAHDFIRDTFLPGQVPVVEGAISNVLPGVVAVGILQISSPPSNLAPSQRGVRPGGIVLLGAAPPQAAAPPPLSIGDLVPPGKLGGSTSQDTVVGPEITAGPGKLGGGPTFTTQVRDAHFPDITERR